MVGIPNVVTLYFGRSQDLSCQCTCRGLGGRFAYEWATQVLWSLGLDNVDHLPQLGTSTLPA